LGFALKHKGKLGGGSVIIIGFSLACGAALRRLNKLIEQKI